MTSIPFGPDCPRCGANTTSLSEDETWYCHGCYTSWPRKGNDDMTRGLDLLMKWEDEGLETLEEAVELAEWLINTGMVNSAGRYGRFVQAVRNGLD